MTLPFLLSGQVEQFDDADLTRVIVALEHAAEGLPLDLHGVNGFIRDCHATIGSLDEPVAEPEAVALPLEGQYAIKAHGRRALIVTHDGARHLIDQLRQLTGEGEP